MNAEAETRFSNTGLKTYLINLDRAKARLEQATREIEAAGLAFTRVEAVDGARIDFPIPEFSESSYRILHGRRTFPAEVGCYLSHIKCIQDFLQSGSDFALILEDDIKLAPDFAQVLARCLAEGRHWDVLRLTTVNSGPKFGALQIAQGYRLAIALSREKGAGGYVINRRAAEWLVSLLPMRLAYDIAFDLEFLAGRTAMFVDPPIAWQDTEAPTQIQINVKSYKLPRYRYLTVLPYRSYLELSRFAIRGLRLLRYKVSRLRRKQDLHQVP